METQVRKNTVKLVCPSGSRIPSHVEVLKFALSVLEIPPPNLHSVYKDENENRFYLKFLDEMKFDDFIRIMDESYIFRYDDGSTVKVSLEIASRFFRYVRIFSLPPEVEDKDIAHVLGQYGTIRQHVRERFAAEHGTAIYTGIRGVHMEVAKEIPPHMFIRHYNVRIFYDGLRNRCWECKAEGHVKADCPRILASSSGSGSSSYAGVTAQGRPTVKSIPMDKSSKHMADAAGPSSTRQQEQKENERVEQRNKEPLVQQVETQAHGTEMETMDFEEAKMAQKRAAERTSSEEGGAVNDDGFITPKNKRGVKKNKAADAAVEPSKEAETSVVANVDPNVEANPMYQFFSHIATALKTKNDELLKQKEEEEQAKLKSQLKKKKNVSFNNK